MVVKIGYQVPAKLVRVLEKLPKSKLVYGLWLEEAVVEREVMRRKQLAKWGG